MPGLHTVVAPFLGCGHWTCPTRRSVDATRSPTVCCARFFSHRINDEASRDVGQFILVGVISFDRSQHGIHAALAQVSDAEMRRAVSGGLGSTRLLIGDVLVVGSTMTANIWRRAKSGAVDARRYCWFSHLLMWCSAVKLLSLVLIPDSSILPGAAGKLNQLFPSPLTAMSCDPKKCYRNLRFSIKTPQGRDNFGPFGSFGGRLARSFSANGLEPTAWVIPENVSGFLVYKLALHGYQENGFFKTLVKHPPYSAYRKPL